LTATHPAASLPGMRISTAVRQHMARLGRLGGQARARALSAEQRSASARKAARARWGTDQKLAISGPEELTSRPTETA